MESRASQGIAGELAGQVSVRLSVATWILLFASTAAVFVLWALTPHCTDDVEVYLLPANFLLLSAWGQIMYLQDAIDLHDSIAVSSIGRLGSKNGVDEFNKLFERYKERQ